MRPGETYGKHWSRDAFLVALALMLCVMPMTSQTGVELEHRTALEAGSRSRLRSAASTYLAYLIVQVIQLGALFSLAPRFFWLDDAQTQFGPMTWWLGKSLRDGRPPMMDPDLGLASNFLADIQYGVLDPLHWGLQYLAGLTDNLLTLSWGFASLCILVLGMGSLTVLILYGVRPALAVAGAVGVASSGFFLWYGGFWWPLMWSVIWLPWLWAGLASRRWPGAVAAGVATWGLLGSGYPYIFPFALLIIAGQVWEARRTLGSYRAMLTPATVARGASCLGGVVIALPTVLTTFQLAPFMLRQVKPDPVLGNSGADIPNFADVVIGGMTLMGQTNAWGGHLARSPSMGTLLVALPLLALVSWKKALKAPGVLTALIVSVSAALMTQVPSVVGVFRVPMRHLVVLQVFLPLLSLIGLSAYPVLKRSRLVLAGLIICLQLLFAILRAPVFLTWHLAAAGLGALALAAAVALLQPSPPVRVPAGIVMVSCAAAALLIGEQMMVALQRQVAPLHLPGESAAPPYREGFPGYGLGVTVKEYRERSYAVDKDLTVLAWGPFEPADRGWRSGVLAGNANLFAGLEPGFGSLAVWQRRLNKHWCNDFVGATCDLRLLSRAKGTQKSWIDLVATNEVLLQKTAPPQLRDYLDRHWRKIAENETWLEYRRPSPLTGRVTNAQNVDVSPDGWRVGPAYRGVPMDSYFVSTGPKTGSLIFRIPYWPGFRATLEGKPVPVSSLDGSLLKVNLPPGLSEARLNVFYEPVGARISTAASVVGIGLISLSALGLKVWPRLRSRRSVSRTS